MADLSKFFLVENGLSFDDDVTIFSGFSDPSSVGESAPVGSLYLRTNGQLWQKFGTADTDWQLITTENSTVKITADDSTPGFLNDKLTVASALIKSVIPSFPSNQALHLDLSPTGVTPGTYTKVTVDPKGRVTAAVNPTTLSGYGITDAQPLHPNLTALANVSAGSPPVGLYTVTGTGLSAARAIVGVTNQTVVTNGDGVAANPVIALAPNAVLPGTGGMRVPTGTQAQETLTTDGLIRYDTELSKFRFRQAGQWLNFGSDLLLYEENAVAPTLPTVTGQNAVAIGEGGTAAGQNSVVLGTSVANAPQSTAIGHGARASSYGQVAFSAKPAATQGSSQGAEYLYSGQTITQYPIEIFLDGVSQRAVFPDPNTAVTFSALVIAQSVSNHGDLFSCRIDGQLFKGATNADTVVTTVTSQWGATYQDMGCTITADTVNGTFKVAVRGLQNQTWRWVVRISAAECIL